MHGQRNDKIPTQIPTSSLTSTQKSFVEQYLYAKQEVVLHVDQFNFSPKVFSDIFHIVLHFMGYLM